MARLVGGATRRGPLRRRRSPHIVPWEIVAAAFAPATPEYAEVAELREMRPSDVASRLQELSPVRRQRLAALLEDDRLADLIEELPDDERIVIIESLDVDRAAHVIEEMEPDDAADLLGELPEDERTALLAAMMPEESTPLRRLLAYDEDTAGGLMTPEPVILPASATVAEALAVIRSHEMPAELSAQVFVVRPPTSTPTGRFLGAVGFQRLLREAPGTALEHCIDDDPDPVRPDCRSATWPSGWRPTTCSRSRSVTTLVDWSARSPSTTCSIGFCQKAGVEGLAGDPPSRRPVAAASRPGHRRALQP